MDIRTVKLKQHPYRIAVGCGEINLLGPYIAKAITSQAAFIITNRFLQRRYGQKINFSLARCGIQAKFFLIPDSEKSKSLLWALAAINKLAAFDTQKGAFVIALGGGVAGDLGGFVASIYRRGIPYVQVPTTLLAQVDSAIGGKTAVDLKSAKNLAGTFYQPKLVFSDVAFLRTLSLRQLRSGLGEVVKYAAIKDPRLFAFLEKNYGRLLKKDGLALRQVVSRCSAIKARIVEQDERETKGIRTILNFGHTVGHAIEAATGYGRVSHGEAISLGMLVACEISRLLKMASPHTQDRISELLKKIGLPQRIKGATLQKIISAHYHDKKFQGTRNKFVLIKAIGSVTIRENIPLEVIREAIKKYL